MIFCCKFIHLWFFLCLSGNVLAVGSGQYAPIEPAPNARQFLLPGKPSSVHQVDNRNLSTNVFKTLLYDQMKIIPISRKDYVLVGFKPGSLIQNFCNGGSQ